MSINTDLPDVSIVDKVMIHKKNKENFLRLTILDKNQEM